MAIESISSVKSHFESGDRPTEQEFINLIDTLGRTTPLAIASAAEGGKTGLYEILSDGDVTARETGAFGLIMLSAASTASARNALGITSVASEFLAAGSTASSRSLLGASTLGDIIFTVGSTASAQTALGISSIGQSVISVAATASAYSVLGLTNTVVQRVYTQTGAVATGTTQVPNDDTIPQNTEGDQYMTLAITPKSTTNVLQIEVMAVGSHSAVVNLVGALFQDSTADALAATHTGVLATNARVFLSLRHTMLAGTTSATTFKFRMGGTGAGTTTFNGAASARLYGGVAASSIVITELSA